MITLANYGDIIFLYEDDSEDDVLKSAECAQVSPYAVFLKPMLLSVTNSPKSAVWGSGENCHNIGMNVNHK